MKKAKIFWRWVYDKRWVLICFAIFIAANFTVNALYLLPVGHALYTSLLGGSIAVLFGVKSLSTYYTKHLQLEKLSGRLPMGQLPNAENLIEEDLQKLITELETERLSQASEAELRQKDSEEYYTLWMHQIKTPIAALHLLLQNAEENEGANKLNTELYKIEQYTSMVLQYQRLNSINADLLLKEHSVEKLVYSALKSTAVLFIAKGVKIEAQELDGVYITDEKWFCFVLEQIFTNAVKYTKSGGSVRVFLNEEKRLVIADSGIGILPEDLPRVFERGYTGNTGRKYEHATGIGLYLCNEISKRLGFAVEIHSEVGQGTSVMLDLKQSKLQID